MTTRRAVLVLLLGWLGLTARSAAEEPELQVTIFGIVATPGGETTDPRLVTIIPELRRLRPDHGFELRKARTERLAPGASLTCDLGDGLIAEARLDHGLDQRGKLRIVFTLWRSGTVELTTGVTTPPNQLFLCEKPLAGSPSKLLIGVSAR